MLVGRSRRERREARGVRHQGDMFFGHWIWLHAFNTLGDARRATARPPYLRPRPRAALRRRGLADGRLKLSDLW